MDSHETLVAGLRRLSAWLQQQGYAFTTVTPATHARVLARDAGPARDLRGVFGWSRPFDAALLPPEPTQALRQAGLLEQRADGLLRSGVRFSTLGSRLYAHDAYPTSAADAVFFGPDTYRYVRLVEAQLQRAPLRVGAAIVDLGCGSGAGGIAAALAAGSAARLTLTDVNARALAFAAANSAQSGLQASLLQGDLYAPLTGSFDLVIANPPYLNDSSERAYRHGGGRWGEALSVRIVLEGLDRLAPGGRLVLYTGVAIVDGEDPLLAAVRPALLQRGWPWHYGEIDPDVFGEELDEPAYAQAERIAAVGLVVERPGPARA